MKNRATFILICLLVCFAKNTFAQKKPLSFGIKAGVDLSTAFVNDVSESKFRTGYQAGITVEYSLIEKISIQSGLFFSTKGSKQEDLRVNNYVGGTPDYTHTFNQQYLELPVYAAYRMAISDKTNLVLGFGPYFAYGIGGKTKQKLNNGTWSNGVTEIQWDTFGDGVFDENRDWLHGESLNRFDFGAGIKADLEYCKYILGLGITSSIINIANTQEYEDLKYRNFNINVSLGYKF